MNKIIKKILTYIFLINLNLNILNSKTINNNLYFDDSELKIIYKKNKKEFKKNFWNLTAEEFYKNNPNYYKKIMYKIINSKNFKNYIFYSSIFLSSSIFFKLFFYNKLNNIKNKKINPSLNLFIKGTNKFFDENLFFKKLIEKYFPNYISSYILNLKPEYKIINKEFNPHTGAEKEIKYYELNSNIEMTNDYFKNNIRTTNEEFINLTFNKFYGMGGVVLIPFLINYLYDTKNKINEWFIKGKYPPIEIYSPDELNVNISNIGGLFLVKESFNKLINRIDNIDKKISAGYVLHGGPGTGKTLSAQYLAKKLDWYFMYIDSSTIMPTTESKYSSTEALKYIFEKAKSLNKCVILFDEFDRIFENDKDIVPQILKLLDNYMNNENIIVIATTNNVKNFDPALLRSGRLSQVILVDNPSLNERIDILEKLFKAKNLKISKKGLTEYAAELTTGFSSALLVELVSKISDIMFINKYEYVYKKVFEEAYFSSVLGNELVNNSFSNEFIEKIASIKALELMFINENKDYYPQFIVFSTLYPYEKNYLDPKSFTGFDYKVNKFETNNELNKTTLINIAKSKMIRIVAEDLLYGSRSIKTEEHIKEIYEIIENIIAIENENLFSNKKIIEKNKNSIFDELYFECLEICKKYLKNKSYNILKNELINNKIVNNNRISEILNNN